MGKFAILYMCGNLVTRKNPEPKVIPDPVYITVCRPGVGIITILESEKRPTDLPPDSEECKPKVPVASCSKLTIMKLDRTQYNLRAAASVNHATISSYVFTVRKGGQTGPVAATKTVASTASTVDSGIISLKDAATYHISVTVKTSIGEKTSADCTGTLTIPPLDKCETNPDLFKNDPECKPCPGNPILWYKSPECREITVPSKSAVNLTQDSVNASTLTAVAGDRIEYKLTVSNPGKVPATATFNEELRDVLEYATIQDNGGGTLNTEKKVLSWPSVQLAPGEKQTRTFVVAVMNTIPTTSRGQSDPTSYDCRMDNTFGDNIQIPVQCDTPKIIESSVSELPKTGPGENMLFAVVLLTVVSYFWARSNQLGKEVRLIRKDFSATGAF